MTEGFHELLARDVAAFGEERVLARRIMIERRPRHAEFARDILERRLAEAEVAEHARRGAQHFDPAVAEAIVGPPARRSEEHTSELQSLMRISYAVFCLKKKKKRTD